MGFNERTEAIRQLRIGRELANVENIGRRAIRGLRMKTEGEVRDYLRDFHSMQKPAKDTPLYVLAGVAALHRRATVIRVSAGGCAFAASFEKEADALERIQLTTAFTTGRPWAHMLRVGGTDTYNLLLPVSGVEDIDSECFAGCLGVREVLNLPCRVLLLPIRNDHWSCVAMMDLEDGIAAYAKLPPKKAPGEE